MTAVALLADSNPSRCDLLLQSFLRCFENSRDAALLKGVIFSYHLCNALRCQENQRHPSSIVPCKYKMILLARNVPTERVAVSSVPNNFTSRQHVMLGERLRSDVRTFFQSTDSQHPRHPFSQPLKLFCMLFSKCGLTDSKRVLSS